MNTVRLGLICSFISGLFTAIPTLAQEPAKAPAPETSIRRHNVGAAAGFISGYGLTYRHWGPSKNGYQVTVIPVARVNEEETFGNISIGGMGLRSIHQTRTTNFFGYYGGHYNFTYQNYKNAPTTNYNGMYYGDYYGDDQQVHNLYAGGGVGVELHFWNLNYSLMFGYAAKGSQEKYPNGRYGNPSTDPIRTFSMQPSVETALFYCF